MTRSVFIVWLLLLTACAHSHGLHVTALHDMLRSEAVSFQGTSLTAPDQAARGRRNPPTLGLYLKPTGFISHEFEWSDGDRDRTVAWAKGLSTRDLLAGATVVVPSSLKGDTLAEVRRAAARYGVDVLLVFGGAAEVDRYNNHTAGLFYWTIVGAYVADGTHSDAVCLIVATAWDVKTGDQLFSETAEGTSSKIGPAALVDDREEVERAKNLALDHVLSRVAERLERAVGAKR